MQIKLLMILVILGTCPLFSQDITKNIDLREPEIGIVENLDAFIPAEFMIIDEKENPVSLVSLLDKPTILNIVYYRCPGICSPIMESVADAVDRMDLILGKDYQIITVSFDPTEGTDLAQKKRENYLNTIKKEVDAEGWRFFTSDSANAINLTSFVGFKYKRVGFDFIHGATIILLSPKGKITRYLQGTFFQPFDVKMALIEAAKGKSGPSITRVLAYCYSFDPAGQRYVMNITKVSGTLIIFFGLVIFLILILKPKAKPNIQK